MNSPDSQERNHSFKDYLAQEVKQKSECADYHNLANLPKSSALSLPDWKRFLFIGLFTLEVVFFFFFTFKYFP